MDAKRLVRLIAIILLVGSVIACAVESERLGQGIEPSCSLIQDHIDTAAAEIARCKALGAAGASDSVSKAAWAKNRERVFAPAQAREPPRTAPQQSPPKLPSEIVPERSPSNLWPDANQIRSPE